MAFFSDAKTRQRIFIALFFVLLTTLKINATPFQLAGDWSEYLRMTHSLSRHGTPDWRAVDERTLRPILIGNGVSANNTDFVLSEKYLGYFKAHNGSRYAWHFWFYSLLAVPFYRLMLFTSGNPFPAFQLLNVLLFFGGCCGAAKILGGINARSATLIGLAAVGPILLLTKWIHSETFLWCATLWMTAFFLQRRYALAALCAAVGSWQNAPLLPVALCCLGAAFYQARREKEPLPWFSSLLTMGVAAVPMLFYGALFGAPSLISQQGFASPRFASWSRIWSLLFDLNQGLILFAPGLLLLFFAAIFLAVKQRDKQRLGLIFIFLVLAWGVTWARDWLAAMAGVQRYAVWMMPILAGVVAAVPRRDRFWRGAILLAIAAQAILVSLHDGRNDSLEVRPLARLVWNIAPAQYNPEYMVFAQRVLGREHAMHWKELPIAYVAPGGDATKILVDAATLKTLPQHYRIVDKAWWQKAQRDYRNVRGWFYIHPPRDAVRP